MRKMPQLTPGKNTTLMTSAFGGYNHQEIIGDSEMYDMQNLGDELYPLLAPRVKRGITSWDTAGEDPVPLTGLHGRDQLVHIRGKKVFYNLIEVQGLEVSDNDNMLPKKIVSFGAYVCIWPDKKYFNTIHQEDHGDMGKSWTASGATMKVNMCRGDGTNYDMTSITVSPTAPSSPTNGQMWIDQSGDNDVLRQYSIATEEWIEVATTYVKIERTGIGQGLKEYDCIDISGLEVPAGSSISQRIKDQVEELNGSKIVYYCGNDYIVIAGLLSRSFVENELKDQTVSAGIEIPDLDFVCESNNRLWGCRYGYSGGKVINEIKASKLGDFRNWECYLGISTDSWTGGVGTDGPFTGVAVQRGYPVFFKENCIHRVSGSMPSSFSISTTMCRGVQEGSWRSVCVVNEAIYYKGRREVLVFDGSMPASVGSQLGNILYSDARAGAVGNKYYISMKDRTGTWRLFNYDTVHKNWHKEDNTHALAFAAVDDELYYIDEDANTLVTVRGSMGTQEDDFDWAAEFGVYGVNYVQSSQYDTPARVRNAKYMSMFKIRMYLDENAYVRLWIKYNDSPIYEYMGERRGNTMRTFVLPVVPKRCDHLRFKITGHGDARIYSISRIMEVGGDGV